MQEIILKTDNISKKYKNSCALEHINLSLERGKIYGLIGKNGAGKTTLMKLICGLSHPTEGSMELFGETTLKEMQNARKRIGSMIEHPGLILNMSARENLRYHRIMRGIPNPEIELELLKTVGLDASGKKKTKHFSLGMKQRLGIAIALMGNPEFLILDEPINGLDPVGVVEIRNLLKSLCRERNITILVSSHNLPELYQTATDYIIIHKGSILRTLTLSQLEEQCRRHIFIQCPSPPELVNVLEGTLNTSNFKVVDDHTVKLYDYVHEQSTVAEVLFSSGILTTDFTLKGDTLEDFFISIVGGKNND